MDALDPRSIRKGSKIRLDDTTEGSDAYVGGTVGHVDPGGRVIIDHMGTFIVEGLGGRPREGYTVYRLAEHTPPKPDPLAELIFHAASPLNIDESVEIADAIRDQFYVVAPADVDIAGLAKTLQASQHYGASLDGPAAAYIARVAKSFLLGGGE